MQKQLEVVIQDKRGAPPAGNSSIGSPDDNSGSRIGSVEVRSSDVEIPPEQQKTGSMSTATPPAPGAVLTSAPVDAPQEEVPTRGSLEHINPAQTPEVTQKPATSERRAVPIEATPSVKMLAPSSAGMTTVNIPSPQALTSDPGESSVNQNSPEQASSIRTSTITLPKETIRRKEGCLRNIAVVQDELKSRKKERESMLVLERRLQELRNRFA